MNERTAQSHGKEANEYKHASCCGYPFFLANNDDGSKTEAVSYV